MPTPDPTFGPAKAYLFNQANANALFAPPVLVCYDEPGPYQPDDIVTFGAVHWHPAVNSIVGGGGTGYLEERYEIEVIVDTFRGGDNGKAAFDRAAALWAGIVQIVRADLTFGGLVLVGKPGMATQTTSWEEGHKGWISHLEGRIDCYQRI